MNKKCPTCGKDLPPIQEPDGSTRYECTCVIGRTHTVLHIIPSTDKVAEKPAKEK
jgi:hypothetical protein